MIRDCQGDPDKLAVLLPCMQYWRDPADDFAWNTISKRAIVYSCGMIALDGVPTVHRHDPAELKLCHTLSAEAASIMKATEAGMGSEGSANLDPFFVTANVGAAVPERIAFTGPLDFYHIFLGVANLSGAPTLRGKLG